MEKRKPSKKLYKKTSHTGGELHVFNMKGFIDEHENCCTLSHLCSLNDEKSLKLSWKRFKHKIGQSKESQAGINHMGW